ncbi:unnamed protein product [Lasius platythorax]|uniref:Uncharacterized protein n=1 Tax=Lasius platythorax TaxID=488582 RepID=A0AAV2N9J3_9HYME
MTTQVVVCSSSCGYDRRKTRREFISGHILDMPPVMIQWDHGNVQTHLILCNFVAQGCGCHQHSRYLE